MRKIGSRLDKDMGIHVGVHNFMGVCAKCGYIQCYVFVKYFGEYVLSSAERVYIFLSLTVHLNSINTLYATKALWVK